MGIVKISDQLHDQVRLSSAALGRSINAQAEHWLRVGQMAEHHPQLNYEGICALLLQQAERDLQLSEPAPAPVALRRPRPVRLVGGLQ
ncbi:MAG: ParD-like family protein [Comamonas sp.]|jgi:plasmid stability protein|uniref:ParD-like family protein n=1 Tax=Comamonas sp. TaxID=34028 RepID=UPI00283802D3|nr:ParD-like family protein [Comamonas sp.]MDR0215065.1 ParD-like family protein [Comamonas sp.]MDR2298453.1 ParD-like family protein [Comamonas sp.]